MSISIRGGAFLANLIVPLMPGELAKSDDAP